jgi:hypothetical protein
MAFTMRCQVNPWVLEMVKIITILIHSHLPKQLMSYHVSFAIQDLEPLSSFSLLRAMTYHLNLSSGGYHLNPN